MEPHRNRQRRTDRSRSSGAPCHARGLQRRSQRVHRCAGRQHLHQLQYPQPGQREVGDRAMAALPFHRLGHRHGERSQRELAIGNQPRRSGQSAGRSQGGESHARIRLRPPPRHSADKRAGSGKCSPPDCRPRSASRPGVRERQRETHRRIAAGWVHLRQRCGHRQQQLGHRRRAYGYGHATACQ